MKQILIVLAPGGAAGDGEIPAGKWLDELTVPYHRFRRAGFSVFAAAPGFAARSGARILEAMRVNAPDLFRGGCDPGLAHLFRLEEVANWHFDALYYAGDHAPEHTAGAPSCSAGLLAEMFDAGKVIGAVSHGPSALLECVRCDGQPLVFRRNVTGLSNAEENEAAAEAKVRLRLEDRLRDAGANYLCKGVWVPHVVVDGNLVTGQNPASAGEVADAMVRQLENS